MFKNIKKRDGRFSKFNSSKITTAIAKAGQVTNEFKTKDAKKLTLRVLSLAEDLKSGELIEVEEIQDIVERVLLDSPFHKTAKAYILYREQRSQIRNITTKANVDLIDKYLKKADWKIKENSNMSYSLQGLNNYISTEIISEYWLNKIYPKKIRQAHKNGDFHIHDLGLLSTYCTGWDLMNLLKIGFKGVIGKTECSSPKHLCSALGQIINFLYTMQGETAGALAFSNFDTLLAPFVRYDNLSYTQVKQNIQEFIFNANVPTRVGFQSPFTNITMDLYVPSTLKDHPVIIGGKEQKTTYSEYQKEMDIINKAFAEVMLNGDAKGSIHAFPIPTYNITKDFDWDNPNLEMIWKMTGKYGIPYFSNFVNSDMSPEDARSMCCRLRLDNRELLKRGGGLFGSAPLTGSIGVVTLNLPRIGYISKTEKEFFNKIEQLINLAKNSLIIKRKVLEQFTKEGLYPYSKFYLQDIEQRLGKYWKNHFSTIGIIGMNEACLNFLGKDIGHEKGKTFAIKIMDFIRDLISNIQEETGDHFNLEATPAEGTTYRLASIDRQKYPNIICANDGSVPFYTNSTHLPVNYTDDILKVLNLQDTLQTKYTGGTVLHLFLGENITDTKSIKNIIKKVSNNFKLPYFTITPTFSVCPTHGYLSGEYFKCNKCGEKTEVYSRIVGYIRPINQWNDSKRIEFDLRKTFDITSIDGKLNKDNDKE